MRPTDPRTVIEAELQRWRPRLVELRRDLHRHPELAFQESRTAAKVAATLGELGLEVREGVGKTGLVGLLRGARPGPTVALRCDMDALTQEEQNDVPYRSTVPGVMHACGHDGHTAMVLAAAAALSAWAREGRGLTGNVKFLFQPAEETVPGGALEMIAGGALADPPVDAIIGVHMWPELRVGQVGIQYGPAMAGSTNLFVTIRGKGGHAGTPHLTVDAIAAAAAAIGAVQQVVSRQTDPADQVVVHFGMIQGGTRRSIVAEQVELAGTIRTLSERVRDGVKARIERTLRGVVEALGGTCTVRFEEGPPPVVNEERVTRVVEEAAREALGGPARGEAGVARGGLDPVVRLDRCPMTAEDFAHYLTRVPGMFLKVGTHDPERGIGGEPLHSPRFDFDEEAIFTGARVLAAAALRLTGGGGASNA